MLQPPIPEYYSLANENATFQYHREVQHAARASLASTGDLTCFKGAALLFLLFLFFLLFFLFIPRRCSGLSEGSEHSPFFKAFFGRERTEKMKGDPAASARPSSARAAARTLKEATALSYALMSAVSSHTSESSLCGGHRPRYRRSTAPLPPPGPPGAHLPGPPPEQHPVRHAAPPPPAAHAQKRHFRRAAASGDGGGGGRAVRSGVCARAAGRERRPVEISPAAVPAAPRGKGREEPQAGGAAVPSEVAWPGTRLEGPGKRGG